MRGKFWKEKRSMKVEEVLEVITDGRKQRPPGSTSEVQTGTTQRNLYQDKSE
jgi:hypothetical protein